MSSTKIVLCSSSIRVDQSNQWVIPTIEWRIFCLLSPVALPLHKIVDCLAKIKDQHDNTRIPSDTVGRIFERQSWEWNVNIEFVFSSYTGSCIVEKQQRLVGFTMENCIQTLDKKLLKVVWRRDWVNSDETYSHGLVTNLRSSSLFFSLSASSKVFLSTFLLLSLHCESAHSLHLSQSLLSTLRGSSIPLRPPFVHFFIG